MQHVLCSTVWVVQGTVRISHDTYVTYLHATQISTVNRISCHGSQVCFCNQSTLFQSHNQHEEDLLHLSGISVILTVPTPARLWLLQNWCLRHHHLVPIHLPIHQPQRNNDMSSGRSISLKSGNWLWCVSGVLGSLDLVVSILAKGCKGIHLESFKLGSLETDLWQVWDSKNLKSSGLHLQSCSPLRLAAWRTV